MGKEINLSEDSTLTGTEFIRAIASDGKSVNIPIDVLQAYIKAHQRFAIFDGAASGSPYNETFSGGNFAHAVRLEFSGARNDVDYFPYPNLIKYEEIAPAGVLFDFLNIPLGTFFEFDVEFGIKYADDSGFRIDEQFIFYFEMTYPNGDVERRTWTMPSDFIVSTAAQEHKIKMSFSTYIKESLTDAIKGGGMEYGVIDTLTGGTKIITIKDLIIRAKL